MQAPSLTSISKQGVALDTAYLPSLRVIKSKSAHAMGAHCVATSELASVGPLLTV
jgi:hypothetical protein